MGLEVEVPIRHTTSGDVIFINDDYSPGPTLNIFYSS